MIRFVCSRCPRVSRDGAKTTWLAQDPTPNNCPECGELVEPSANPEGETMPKQVHHVFVRDRATKVWHHETAFSIEADAIAERDDYREKPTTLAVKVIKGPDGFDFAASKARELNGEVAS